jgi:hypothetical protein
MTVDIIAPRSDNHLIRLTSRDKVTKWAAPPIKAAISASYSFESNADVQIISSHHEN